MTDLAAWFSPPVLADLALAHHEDEQRKAAEPGCSDGPRALALLLALQPEIARLSVLSVACASVANALAGSQSRRGASPDARSLLRSFPSESSRYILAASRFRRFRPDSPAGYCLDGLNDALGEALGATIEFAASRFELGEGAKALRERVAGAWRRACAAEIRLLDAIRDELSRYQLGDGSATSAELLTALRRGAEGSTPFLSPAGTLELPPWAELRRSQRMNVNSRAALLCRGRQQEVRVTDISTGGAGIEFSAPLQQKDQVTLVVKGSIVMTGRVVWVHGHHAGIKFHQPFYDDAPELHFISRHTVSPD